MSNAPTPPSGITLISNVPAPPSTNWVPWFVGGVALAAAGALSYVALQRRALRNPIADLGDPEVIHMSDGRLRYKFLHGIYIEKRLIAGTRHIEFTAWQVGEAGAKSRLLGTSSSMDGAKAIARERGESTQEFLARIGMRNPTITVSLTPEEQAALQRSIEKNQAALQSHIAKGQMTFGGSMVQAKPNPIGKYNISEFLWSSFISPAHRRALENDIRLHGHMRDKRTYDKWKRVLTKDAQRRWKANPIRSTHERREMEDLLQRYGYDPAYAADLRHEGMGPYELESRLKNRPGSIGSLEYTHNIHRIRRNPTDRRGTHSGGYAAYRAALADQLINRYGFTYGQASNILDMTSSEFPSAFAAGLYDHGVKVSTAARLIYKTVRMTTRPFT
jgi:hypothetical protein